MQCTRLKRADVILYDALIDHSALELARRDARRIDVGKRYGRHAISQAAINRLILQLAQSGAHVVRLKGGDPMVFGRAGEALAALRSVGVPVEVIPGVTAACAAAARLAVPLTHRGVARSLHFVSGHGDDVTVPAYDWAALARSGGTIAAYMASRTLSAAAQRLPQACRRPHQRWRSRMPAKMTRELSLSHLVNYQDSSRKAGSMDPTLVLIGAVVGLAHARTAILADAA